jgi:phosphoesterase RecJ-like protein
MSRQTVLDLIRRGSRFLVTCHLRPDADALGSALGFAAILRSIGKDARVYSQDPPPRMLGFLPGIDTVARDPSNGGAYDATFVMDAAASPLVPKVPREISGPIVMLDHHAAHDDYGDIVLRETDAVATGVVVLRLMRDLGVARVPPEAAAPLYAAIVADTGGFRYLGTNPETMRLAAELMEAGADPWTTAYNLFEGWEPARMTLLGDILEHLEMELDGRVAVLTITRTMLAEHGADDEMVEGMVNYGRMLRGVDISILFWEIELTRGEGLVTKVSLRSSGKADVAWIAKQLGGGGHMSAAGANLKEPIVDARRRVLDLARTALERPPTARFSVRP